MPFLSIILPAFDEEIYLEPAVATIATRMASAGFPYEIIVVDDGSRDATAERAKEIGGRFDPRGSSGDVAVWSELRVISYAANRGKGHAVRTGVLASRGRFVMFMDVDLSTSPSYIPAFLTEAAAGHDVVVASRKMPGSSCHPPQGLVRRLAGRVFTRLSCAVLGLPRATTDVTCGFKMFRGTVARALFAKAQLDGWGFDAEILFLAHRAGLSIRELPVRWSNRADSRVRVLRDAFRSLGELAAVRRQAASGSYGGFELPAVWPEAAAGAGAASGPVLAGESGLDAAGLQALPPALEEGAETGAGVGGRESRDLLRRS